MFNKMKDCNVDVMKFCVKDQMTESQIKDKIDASLKKENLCYQDYAELPTSSPSSIPCSASYNYGEQNCMRSFRQKFMKDKSDPTLCS